MAWPWCRKQTKTDDQRPLLAAAINAADSWWRSFYGDDPDFYERINFGALVVHLCGSRARLAEVHNALYPDTPYDPHGPTYMFTGAGPNLDLTRPVQVWMVVKARRGKALLHKWAAGHELARALSCFSGSLENADRY